MNEFKQEDPVRSPTRSLFRVVVVVLLGAAILALTVPNIIVTARGGSPAMLGVTLTPDFLVTSVVPGTPAAEAGLRVRDRIEMGGLTLWQRIHELGAPQLQPGESLKIPIIRNGARLAISVTGETAGPGSFYLTLTKRTAASIFVMVAGALLLLRPSRMLWGFYLYALGSVGGGALFYTFLSGWLEFVLFALMYGIYYSLFYLAGLWIFVARFPGDSADGWRVWIDRAAIPFASLYAGASVASLILSLVLSNTVPQPMIVSYVFAAVNNAAVALAMVCLLSGFVHLQADQRQRLKWVVAAVVTYALAVGYISVANFLPLGGWPATWTSAGFTSDVLNGVQVIIPLAVAYAVLKHRVLDVNFVISRALVYGILTAFVVGAFAIIDWVLGRALEHQQLAIAAEVVAAVGFGFGLNGMHKSVDSFVDRVLFRQRHFAERRLERVANGLPHAKSPETVDSMLVEEPVQAFGLHSAAVFRERDDSHSFVRLAQAGWPEGSAAELHGDDPLMIHLQGERGVMRLRDARSTRGKMPSGAAAPVLAIPLIVRHQVEGVVLYGQHRTGEDIDPDEIRTLERLAISAAVAYDHIEADQMRRRAAELERELSDIQTEVLALRSALAQGRT